jgi:hypothetical protein
MLSACVTLNSRGTGMFVWTREVVSGTEGWQNTTLELSDNLPVLAKLLDLNRLSKATVKRSNSYPGVQRGTRVPAQILLTQRRQQARNMLLLLLKVEQRVEYFTLPCADPCIHTFLVRTLVPRSCNHLITSRICMCHFHSCPRPHEFNQHT